MASPQAGTASSNGAPSQAEVPRAEQTPTTTNGGAPKTDSVLETEFLIVGAGPSGASLACFLASYGIKGIMIASAPGTANTPRAHITNMAALECLRDIGLEEEIMKVASDGSCMMHTRWCHSMAGEEFARAYSWGNDPKRKGDYEAASPCTHVDLPQTLLEPILVRHAIHNGFKVRFDTALVSFVQDAETKKYTVRVRDRVTEAEYAIRTTYLLGADGAQSQVVKQLDLPLIKKPGQGLAINVLVEADLSHLVDARRGNLHWIMQPDQAHPDFAWLGIVRMVKPWHEWMFILLPKRDADYSIQPTEAEYLQRVHEMIGDDTPVKILNISKWFINEIVAETYAVGNAICLGDAVHRHPPFNGLGSNTCIQDAFNLAWKLAFVHKGLASPSLLDTYSAERQPVGHGVITRANQGFRDHFPVMEALGTLPEDIAERRRILDELRASHPDGQARRQAFRKAIQQTAHEVLGLGIEMGQHYQSTGTYTADEALPYTPAGRAAEDPILYYEPSTYPGCRLPHVWLNTAVPGKPTSTLDLAGHGQFVLLTGIGGDAWKEAAAQVSAKLGGVPLAVHTIGFRQDWEDFYFHWEEIRGVDESGVVLVRPDRFVAWRYRQVLDSTEACASKLESVLRSILDVE